MCLGLFVADISAHSPRRLRFRRTMFECGATAWTEWQDQSPAVGDSILHTLRDKSSSVVRHKLLILLSKKRESENGSFSIK